MSVAWLHAVAINLNARPRSGSRGHGFAGCDQPPIRHLRSYISAGLASRLYADASQKRSRETPLFRSVAPRSEHGKVLAESSHVQPDLKLIRRKFAMANHPDRVAPRVRGHATRRTTIANMLIDGALRGLNARTR